MEPILPYLVLALGLIGSLLLFFSLKHELHAQSRKQRQKMDGLAAGLKAVAEQEALLEPSGPRPGPGFNLNRRVQAMRMLRRGEGTTHIAAALGVPDKEVELLIRVQRITAGSTIPAPR
jgi:hypothetical protein